MIINVIFALSLSCFVDHVQFLSSIGISQKKGKINVHIYKPITKKDAMSVVKAWSNISKTKDVRILAVAWMESRLRPRVQRGDKGKACGMHQIHARYSYPLFRRGKGFSGWDENSPKAKLKIRRECKKLENKNYSMKTMIMLLELFDNKNKHHCHHNSGLYGRCNRWYKKRLDIITSYLYIGAIMCERGHKWE